VSTVLSEIHSEVSGANAGMALCETQEHPRETG
jgi:hypothetical protein